MKMVNVVKARPLNPRVFSALCNDFLQHTEVCWLSRCKVSTRFFFKLRDELKVFFTDHNFHLSERLNDDEFYTRLAYLGDVFSHLNDLNLGLQRLSATIFNVRDKIEAMIKKLELFATAYLCESGFSALTSMKTKYRHRLCVENDLRPRLSPIQPNIAELCAFFQAHPFH